jgi:hypothetical protein
MLCRDEDREMPFQALVTEDSIVAVAKEMVQFKKALVANDIIAEIQKAVETESADKSPDFKFELNRAELLPETMAKFDLLAGRCHVPCPSQPQSHYLLHILLADLIKMVLEEKGGESVVLMLEGRSHIDLKIAHKRSKTAHKYLMDKGGDEDFCKNKW